jgi:hypothetical protein
MADYDYSMFTKAADEPFAGRSRIVDPEQYKRPMGTLEYQGRGSVNPPMIYEPQPMAGANKRRGNLPTSGYYIPRNVNNQATLSDIAMVVPEGIGNIGKIVGPTALAAGHAASMNLDDPVVSAAKALITNKSYKKTRAEQAEMRKLLEAEYPISSTVGNIAGSLYTGARALPAATQSIAPKFATMFGGIPATMVEQGIQSGISTAAGNPDATSDDVATSSGLSALFSGTLGLVGKGAGAAGQFLDRATVLKSISQLKNLVNSGDSSATASLQRLFPNIDKSQVRNHANNIVLMAEESLINKVSPKVVAQEFRDYNNLQPRILDETQLLDNPFVSVARQTGNALVNNPFGLVGAAYGAITDPGSIPDKLMSAAKYGVMGAAADRVPSVLAKSAGTTAPESIQSIFQSKVLPSAMSGPVRNMLPNLNQSQLQPLAEPQLQDYDYSMFTKSKN